MFTISAFYYLQGPFCYIAVDRCPDSKNYATKCLRTVSSDLLLCTECGKHLQNDEYLFVI
jgi:hypothetical protein